VRNESHTTPRCSPRPVERLTTTIWSAASLFWVECGGRALSPIYFGNGPLLRVGPYIIVRRYSYMEAVSKSVLMIFIAFSRRPR
jgi:hypothetical protein